MGRSPGENLAVGRHMLLVAAPVGAALGAVIVAEATGNAFLVVPSPVASAVTFTGAAGVSNSRSQRLHRRDRQERLRGAPVSGVMTTAPTLGDGQPVADAEELLRAGRCDYVPVIDPASRRLVGMVSSSDVSRALAAAPGSRG